MMWTSGAKKGGSVSDCKACLASFCGTAYWNHKWLNVSQMVLIQVEPGEKLAGRLNIIDAFWLRNKFGCFFFPFQAFCKLVKRKKNPWYLIVFLLVALLVYVCSFEQENQMNECAVNKDEIQVLKGDKAVRVSGIQWTWFCVCVCVSILTHLLLNH